MSTNQIESIFAAVDPPTLRAFVIELRRIIDAQLAAPVQLSNPPAPGQIDYVGGTLHDHAPPGGWLSDAEIASVHRQMIEAITAENWVKGAMFMLQFLMMCGAV